MNLPKLQTEINKNIKYLKVDISCKVFSSGNDFTIELTRRLSDKSSYVDYIEMPGEDFEKILKSFETSNKNGKLNRFLNRG